MCYLQGLRLFIETVLRGFVDFFRNLDKLWALLCYFVTIQCARARLPGRIGKGSPLRCVKVSDPAFKRPDPMIYDQYWLMAQGLAVTWDNPDIELRRGGMVVPSHALQPDTEYQIVARIWNNSTEAPVVGLPVAFSFLSFGVGTTSTSIGQTAVDLGVKGGPNHPAFATVTWRTPATPGHYCIQAALIWLDDVNPNNNLGQENTTVATAHSRAEASFRLRNRDSQQQPFRFEADGYVIPPPPVCAPTQLPPRTPLPPRLMVAPGTIASVPAAHDRRTQGLPAEWRIAFEPAAPVLAPEEEIAVVVSITPPDGFIGRQSINVHAFTPRGLAGGMTLIVEA
jgi:hypothetical protein